MARKFTDQQRATLSKLKKPVVNVQDLADPRGRSDTSGGRAYQEWKAEPGANWRPPSQNGEAQAHPLPNTGRRKPWDAKPKPIPNAHDNWSATERNRRRPA